MDTGMKGLEMVRASLPGLSIRVGGLDGPAAEVDREQER